MKMKDWLRSKSNQLRMKGLILWNSNFRYFFIGLISGIFGTGALLLFLGNFPAINLALQNIDGGDRLQFFTSIAASIAGVLAITFSLTVFALQHAAENGSVQILKDFTDSPRVLWDYMVVAALAVTLFVLALTPQGSGLFTSLSLLFAIVVIIFVFWRIYGFYRFIVDFINPAERIRKLGQKVSDYLEKVRKLLLALKQAEQKPEADPPPSTSIHVPQEDMFVTANFDHADIFNSFQAQVLSLIDTMRLYTERRKYEVTAAGYRALIQIASTYFQQRKYSTAHVSILLQDGRTDQYLMFVLEQLNDLFRQLIKTEDQTGLQQNFQCFVAIAIQANSYKILSRDVSNPNVDFVVGYLHRNLVEALYKNVDDATMTGVRHLKSVISYVPFSDYLTAKQLGDDFQEQALVATSLKKWYITQEAVIGIVKVIAWGLASGDISRSLVKSSLQGLSKVAALYLQSGLNIGVNAEGLNAAISNVNEQSVPRLLNEYIVQNWEKKEEFDNDTFEEFLDYYEELGRIAVEANSFLLHFVLSALDLHLEQLTILKWNKKQHDVENLTIAIKEVIAIYRNIFSFLPEGYTKRNFGHMEYERLKSNALWAIKKKDKETVDEIIKVFLRFYQMSLSKTKDEFTSIRIYVDAVELAAYAWAAGMKDIAQVVVDLAPEVQAQHLKDRSGNGIPEKYTEEAKERLSREIWRIYGDYRSYDPMRHPDIKIENMISYEDLKTFLNLIEMKVYSRETTEYREGRTF
ncbi:DUF2254 domain-containing protein [Patescibacteria group bacterium]|nr:DUF2254 domain-containing protein [Patescibacteria group bacterium]